LLDCDCDCDCGRERELADGAERRDAAELRALPELPELELRELPDLRELPELPELRELPELPERVERPELDEPREPCDRDALAAGREAAAARVFGLADEPDLLFPPCPLRERDELLALLPCRLFPELLPVAIKVLRSNVCPGPTTPANEV
jgi:hypothetical protein